MNEDTSGNTEAVFLAELKGHTKNVNAVRFAPDGSKLASASDDGSVIIWTLQQHIPSWAAVTSDRDVNSTLLRHVSEVYDISWSPDSSCLACGSVDNKTSVWDVSRAGDADAPKPKDPQALHDHGNFVTGVAWDPVGSLLATQSNDRSIRIYNRPVPQWTVPRLRSDGKAKQIMKAALPPVGAPPSGWEHVPYMGVRLHAKNGRSKPFSSVASVRKVSLSGIQAWEPSSESGADAAAAAAAASPSATTEAGGAAAPQPSGPRGFVFMDERVPSYFRRLDWSADGSLLIAPAGQDPRSHRDDPVPTTNVFVRDQWDGPVMQLGGLPSASLVVRSNPVLFSTAGAVEVAATAPGSDGAAQPPTAASATAPSPDASSAEATAPSTAAVAAAGTASSTAAAPLATGGAQADSKTPRAMSGQGKLHKDDVTPFDFPFRSVFAVATLESVFVYDTEHTTPVAAAANHHFEKITDMAWSRDGKLLLVASIDGSVSVMSFASGEGGPSVSRGGNELGSPLPFAELPDHLQLRPTPCTAAETRWLLAVRAHEQAKRVPKGPGRPTAGGAAASGGAAGGKQTARAAPATAAGGAAATATVPSDTAPSVAPAGDKAVKRIQPQLVSAQPDSAANAAGATASKSGAGGVEGGVKRKRVTPTLVSVPSEQPTEAPVGDAAASSAAASAAEGGVGGASGGGASAPAPAANKARRITPTFVSS